MLTISGIVTRPVTLRKGLQVVGRAVEFSISWTDRSNSYQSRALRDCLPRA